MTSLQQHQVEIEKNLAAWHRKPLLQKIYTGFYKKILQHIDRNLPGVVVEIGSGIGNLKSHLPNVICTDLFSNPWLDVVCDAYDLPFANGTVSHLILFDVFHHLRRPRAFLNEASRVLTAGGRVILFEPFISLTSFPIYALLHHEPVAWNAAIDFAQTCPQPRDYYAAQGNATRLFFRRNEKNWMAGLTIAHAETFSVFGYFFSGGYSKPALYPTALLGILNRVDHLLSRLPRIFGGRCLVVLHRAQRL